MLRVWLSHLKSKMLLFVWLLLVAIVAGAPEVEITQGRLRGKHRVTRSNRTFSAFEGIPFAKPPIGELRFKVGYTISQKFEHVVANLLKDNGFSAGAGSWRCLGWDQGGHQYAQNMPAEGYLQEGDAYWRGWGLFVPQCLYAAGRELFDCLGW